MSRPVRYCTVEGCEARHHARGYCKTHWHTLWYANQPIKHGLTGYMAQGCRCAICAEAARNRKRNR